MTAPKGRPSGLTDDGSGEMRRELAEQGTLMAFKPVGAD